MRPPARDGHHSAILAFASNFLGKSKHCLSLTGAESQVRRQLLRPKTVPTKRPCRNLCQIPGQLQRRKPVAVRLATPQAPDTSIQCEVCKIVQHPSLRFLAGVSPEFELVSRRSKIIAVVRVKFILYSGLRLHCRLLTDAEMAF